MDKNTNGLQIIKPATATDGYEGGLEVIRDTSTAVGGQKGMVNCGLLSKTIAGKDVKNFEWNGLFILENHSDEGENVALYAQGNKLGVGPTWAACFEACDTTTNPSGTVGIEADCWVTGADTGNRIGVDVVCGDAKASRSLGVSDKAEASVGLRVSTSNTSPNAKWMSGMQVIGNANTGLDVSTCTASTGIKLNKNQTIMIGDTVISASGTTVKPPILVYAALVLSVIAILLNIFH